MVNGKLVTIPDGATIADVVARLAGAGGPTELPTGIAVARGGTVVPRAQWRHANLVDGDLVEVLTATQGG
jgi:thiamine biosynthesis protein ThiS